MNLAELKNNEKGVITKVKGRGAFRKRITEMGFVKGQLVTVIKNAPFKDPIQYRVMDYEISLRRSEAQLIEVISEEEAKTLPHIQYDGVITDDILKKSAKEKSNTINVALVGNPNCGKTTIFNQASRSKEHVGNYSGVTVSAKTAKFEQNNYKFNIIDLPGTYSLTTYTPEELYVRKYIFNNAPDIVINVIDASNIERNLFLTTQLIDMDIKVVIALNMYDELEKKGDHFDYDKLGKMIGIPIIPTVGAKAKGITELFDEIIKVYEDKEPFVRHIHINYGLEVEQSINDIQAEVWENKSVTDKISSRFLSLKLIEKDEDAHKALAKASNYDEIKQATDKEIKRLELLLKNDSETIITDAKYGFIAGALKETYKANPKSPENKTKKIDNFLTHKFWGFPIFIFFIWLMFFSTFFLGSFPKEWLESLVRFAADAINGALSEGSFKDLLIDGVIGGVGGVLIFLPNILILFFFISIMEDTGYMARTAFIMDKVMHKIGLHGKSFIPMIMGFGCTVPAIMATRTLENRNDRLLTMLITPFMSCSARLPIYVLLISAFFPTYPTLVLFSIYIIGVVLAALVAIIFKKILFKSKEVPFVMELPPYRIPTAKATIRHMWSRAGQYLKKMGGVILIASIIIWALGYFPKNIEYTKDYDQLITQTQTEIDNAAEDELLIKEKKGEIVDLIISQESERQKNSYIGRIGQFIEPIVRPMGFDWRMGVSLLSGVAGKEIVVSTMAVLYYAEENDENKSGSLIDRLQNQTYKEGKKKGEKVFTPLIAFAFLMFVLIYFPCIAVIAAIKKESESWSWAIFSIVYTTGLAWFVSFLIYQIGSLVLI